MGDVHTVIVIVLAGVIRNLAIIGGVNLYTIVIVRGACIVHECVIAR